MSIVAVGFMCGFKSGWSANWGDEGVSGSNRSLGVNDISSTDRDAGEEEDYGEGQEVR
jgi:hypothetical protein